MSLYLPHFPKLFYLGICFNCSGVSCSCTELLPHFYLDSQASKRVKLNRGLQSTCFIRPIHKIKDFALKLWYCLIGTAAGFLVRAALQAKQRSESSPIKCHITLQSHKKLSLFKPISLRLLVKIQQSVVACMHCIVTPIADRLHRQSHIDLSYEARYSNTSIHL